MMSISANYYKGHIIFYSDPEEIRAYGKAPDRPVLTGSLEYYVVKDIEHRLDTPIKHVGGRRCALGVDLRRLPPDLGSRVVSAVGC